MSYMPGSDVLQSQRCCSTESTAMGHQKGGVPLHSSLQSWPWVPGALRCPRPLWVGGITDGGAGAGLYVGPSAALMLLQAHKLTNPATAIHAIILLEISKNCNDKAFTEIASQHNQLLKHTDVQAGRQYWHSASPEVTEGTSYRMQLCQRPSQHH